MLAERHAGIFWGSWLVLFAYVIFNSYLSFRAWYVCVYYYIFSDCECAMKKTGSRILIPAM